MREYKSFNLPKNIVSFNVMLNEIGFPMKHSICEYDGYEFINTDAEKYEMIGQMYCVMSDENKKIVSDIFAESLAILNEMNK